MKTAEIEEYRRYTLPAELHKAVNMLKGIVSGIKADEIIVDSEVVELSHWCSLHAHLRNKNPFSELLPVIENALEDGVIDAEEREDILWLCSNFEADCQYYDVITSATQYLNGLIHGMMADGKLTDKEIVALNQWLTDNDYLQGTYPFDETLSLTSAMLADHKISPDERNTLMAFFSNVIDFRDSYNLMEPDFKKLREKYSVQGICAFCPEIEFEDKVFCFTGASYKATRAELADIVSSHGGLLRDGVSRKTNYLIVGNDGNPCWAYSCYGRKIEEAINLRKEGFKLQIVNETDFWDVISDLA